MEGITMSCIRYMSWTRSPYLLWKRPCLYRQGNPCKIGCSSRRTTDPLTRSVGFVPEPLITELPIDHTPEPLITWLCCGLRSRCVVLIIGRHNKKAVTMGIRELKERTWFHYLNYEKWTGRGTRRKEEDEEKHGLNTCRWMLNSSIVMVWV